MACLIAGDIFCFVTRSADVKKAAGPSPMLRTAGGSGALVVSSADASSSASACNASLSLSALSPPDLSVCCAEGGVGGGTVFYKTKHVSFISENLEQTG